MDWREYKFDELELDSPSGSNGSLRDSKTLIHLAPPPRGLKSPQELEKAGAGWESMGTAFWQSEDIAVPLGWLSMPDDDCLRVIYRGFGVKVGSFDEELKNLASMGPADRATARRRLFKTVLGILKTLEPTGRGHGNLHADQVFVEQPGGPETLRFRLALPAPPGDSAGRGMVAKDLQGLGAMLWRFYWSTSVAPISFAGFEKRTSGDNTLQPNDYKQWKNLEKIEREESHLWFLICRELLAKDRQGLPELDRELLESWDRRLNRTYPWKRVAASVLIALVVAGVIATGIIWHQKSRTGKIVPPPEEGSTSIEKEIKRLGELTTGIDQLDLNKLSTKWNQFSTFEKGLTEQQRPLLKDKLSSASNSYVNSINSNLRLAISALEVNKVRDTKKLSEVVSELEKVEEHVNSLPHSKELGAEILNLRGQITTETNALVQLEKLIGKANGTNLSNTIGELEKEIPTKGVSSLFVSRWEILSNILSNFKANQEQLKLSGDTQQFDRFKVSFTNYLNSIRTNVYESLVQPDWSEQIRELPNSKQQEARGLQTRASEAFKKEKSERSERLKMVEAELKRTLDSLQYETWRPDLKVSEDLVKWRGTNQFINSTNLATSVATLENDLRKRAGTIDENNFSTYTNELNGIVKLTSDLKWPENATKALANTNRFPLLDEGRVFLDFKHFRNWSTKAWNAHGTLSNLWNDYSALTNMLAPFSSDPNMVPTENEKTLLSEYKSKFSFQKDRIQAILNRKPVARTEIADREAKFVKRGQIVISRALVDEKLYAQVMKSSGNGVSSSPKKFTKAELGKFIEALNKDKDALQSLYPNAKSARLPKLSEFSQFNIGNLDIAENVRNAGLIDFNQNFLPEFVRDEQGNLKVLGDRNNNTIRTGSFSSGTNVGEDQTYGIRLVFNE